MTKPISILGIFVADLTFRTDRMPLKGETFIGNSFKLGPGGKGSNQAVATRRAGAETIFITKFAIHRGFRDLCCPTNRIDRNIS